MNDQFYNAIESQEALDVHFDLVWNSSVVHIQDNEWFGNRTQGVQFCVQTLNPLTTNLAFNGNNV